jgi:catechol 2,3-dioxygenase
MKIESLGHVVLKVTDLERSEQFYTGLLGMSVCARFDEQGMKMTFFSLGNNHHDLALFQVPAAQAGGGDPPGGLHHVAFCLGNSLDRLVQAKDQLEAAGVRVDPTDHDVTKSLYFSDPDGNLIEVYIDVSDAWRTDPQRIATVRPLAL